MCLHVSFQVPTLRKRFAAVFEGALVGPFACVSSNVDLEGASSQKSRIANVAAKWPTAPKLSPLIIVSAKVVFEVSLGGEGLGTVGVMALVGLFASVDAQVGFEVALLSESLVAPSVAAGKGPFSRLP